MNKLWKGIGNAIAITICLLLLVLGGIAAARAAEPIRSASDGAASAWDGC